jgi:hypothetical protein
LIPGDETPFAEVVAMTSEVLAVASVHSPAPVRIFSASAGGGWTEQARFDPLGAGNVDGSAAAIAVASDSVAVAFPFELDGDLEGAGVRFGAVHVYRRTPGGWSPDGVVWTPLAASRASFGHAVALSDDELVVGAPHAPGGGSVFVFERSGPATWELSEELHGTGNVAELFGWSLALRDSALVVGAPGYGDHDKPGTGAVHVFARHADATWARTALLVPSDARARKLPPCISMGCLYAAKYFERFGESVDLQTDRLVVGAPAAGPRDEVRAQNYPWVAGKGAVYLFTADRAQGTWLEEGRILSPDASPGFGSTVRLSGSLLVAGTPELREEREGRYEHTGESATWVFEHTDQSWVSRRLIRAPAEPGARTISFAVDNGRVAVAGLAGEPAGGFTDIVDLQQSGGAP